VARFGGGGQNGGGEAGGEADRKAKKTFHGVPAW
jgi:hypothetical protein